MEAGLAKIRILVVDDEEKVRSLLVRILELQYESVETAENGEVALDMLKKKTYDLLIVDLNMPKVTGQELVKQIRKNGDERTSFIILTGHGALEDAYALLEEVNISDFLNKPVGRAVLLFSVKRALREQQLTHHLEELVAERTAELRASQAQLIQSEKMASLGRLVAGVAHEVNTPIGTVLLGISHLEEKGHAFSNSLNSGGVTKNELESLLEVIHDTIQESKTALGEANRILSHFKQLAVDQTSENKREFALNTVIDGVLSSLQIHKMEKVKTEINCPADIVLNSFPGPLGQVLNNLVQNTMLHGFEGKQSGSIGVEAKAENGIVSIRYHDDGIGMEAESVKRIFDPFFTTKANQGGNGIGMSITFNIVTEVLNGTIECESEPGSGASFIIRIPLIVKGKE